MESLKASLANMEMEQHCVSLDFEIGEGTWNLLQSEKLKFQ